VRGALQCEPFKKHRTSLSSRWHSCFVFRRSRFKSRPGDRMSWLRVFVVFPTPSTRMPE